MTDLRDRIYNLSNSNDCHIKSLVNHVSIEIELLKRPNTCAGPESFAGGGPPLTFSFVLFFLLGERGFK